MKAYVRHLFTGAGLVLIMACGGDSISGSWEGLFMDQFPTSLIFTGDGNEITGYVKMYDAGIEIQNDPLTRVKLKGEQLSFYIPAKETRFSGILDETTGSIEGIFHFSRQIGTSL